MATEMKHPDSLVSAVLMQLLDVDGRLAEKAETLDRMCRWPTADGDFLENPRLVGKAQGVRLARSVVQEEIRKWRKPERDPMKGKRCADGSLTHDFKGGAVCPACGFTGLST